MKAVGRSAALACMLFMEIACGLEARGSDDLLLLATTTSVRDSGLLDELLPRFRERSGMRVKTIAVGTGAALRLADQGDVDVVIAHAPTAEQKLVDSGSVIARVPFMENHFVIAGPPDDPAGVRGAATAHDAYRRIAAANAPYASRGDDSGTHKREQELLALAGLESEGGWPGFAQTGSGMGLTLQVAGERRAYVLSDIGTFLAYRDRLDLEVLSPPSPELRNVYSVLRVNPETFADRINASGAEQFVAFLVDEAILRRIADFGVDRFGRPLFRPYLETPAGLPPPE